MKQYPRVQRMLELRQRRHAAGDEEALRPPPKNHPPMARFESTLAVELDQANEVAVLLTEISEPTRRPDCGGSLDVPELPAPAPEPLPAPAPAPADLVDRWCKEEGSTTTTTTTTTASFITQEHPQVPTTSQPPGITEAPTLSQEEAVRLLQRNFRAWRWWLHQRTFAATPISIPTIATATATTTATTATMTHQVIRIQRWYRRIRQRPLLRRTLRHWHGYAWYRTRWQLRMREKQLLWERDLARPLLRRFQREERDRIVAEEGKYAMARRYHERYG